MGSRSQRPCLGASCPMVLVGNMHKNTTQFTSSGASCYFLCRQCPLTAEVQVCRCSSGDKHSILANCFFLTRCGLAVVNVPLIFFFLLFLFPQSGFALFCFSSTHTMGLSLSLACLLGWPTKPCCTALLHPAEEQRLSSAASPGYSTRAMLQKAALTRKWCPCQSVPIREPVLSSALRHSSPNTNNT